MENTIIRDGFSSEQGGCVVINGATFLMTGGSISDCNSLSGGGIRISSVGLTTIRSVSFFNNSATIGGAISFENVIY